MSSNVLRTKADAVEILGLIKNKKVKPVDLITESIRLIKSTHGRINAAVKIFEKEALKQAKRPKKGKLSGLPISIKETLGIEGEEVTAGSVRMPVQYQEKDSEIVRRLKAEGAIIVTRSNVPEFAVSHETDNLRYGRTNNPHNSKYISGGSSGGEGALIGAGCVALGVGSDIGGSILYPAQCCGVVGFKPASQAVDKMGTFPAVETFTRNWLALGPIARSIRDAKLVYNIIAKKDYRAGTKKMKPRLIIPKSFEMSIKSEYLNEALNYSKKTLAQEGFSLEEQVIEDAGKIYTAFISLIIADLEEPMRRLLITKEGKKFSLMAELMRQIIGKPTIWPGLFRTLLGMPLIRPGRKKIFKIQDLIKDLQNKYHDILGDDGIMLLPTSGDVALKHKKAVSIDNRLGVQGVFTPTVFCNAMNLPSISIPAHKFKDPKTNLTPGIMLSSAPGGETALFQMAEVLEKRIRSTPS